MFAALFRGVPFAASACLFAGLWLAGSPAAAQNADLDLCFNYANQFIASAVRGQQAKCPAFQKLNMNWDTHFNWCQAQGRQKVLDAQETLNAQLDGCLISAQGNAAPPPPRGKVFYVVPEGAEVNVPRLCVDVAGGKLAQSTLIQLWGCHGKAPQRFGLDPRNGRIFLAANPKLCVDGVPKQQLLLVPCQSTEAQWRYDEKTSTIRSSNGMCWDMFGGNRPQNIRSREAVYAWPCHGGPNQQFVFND